MEHEDGLKEMEKMKKIGDEGEREEKSWNMELKGTKKKMKKSRGVEVKEI